MSPSDSLRSKLEIPTYYQITLDRQQAEALVAEIEVLRTLAKTNQAEIDRLRSYVHELEDMWDHAR